MEGGSGKQESSTVRWRVFCFWLISKLSIYKLASLCTSGSAASEGMEGWGRRGMWAESLVVHNWIRSELTGRSSEGAERRELHSQTTALPDRCSVREI